MRNLFVWCVAVALAVAASHFLERSSEPQGDVERTEAAASSSTASAKRAPRVSTLDGPADSSRRPRSATATSPHRLPKSLRGTDVDGALTTDADGNFIANADAVALFEYYLTALGEESYEQIVARVTAAIHETLMGSAATSAVAFFQQYLDYRARAGALVETEQEGSLREGFEQLRALRREVFGEALADELFAAEEARAEVTMLQREIAADPDLDDTERRRLIDEAFEFLPTEQREARRRARAHIDLAAAEQALRDEGANREDIQRLRTEQVGEEAAERLAKLDEQRAEWDARVAAFRAERSRIERDASLTADERRSLVDETRSRDFSEPERRRLEALDRIQATATR